MDPRLVPLNGVLALLATSRHAWPNCLTRQGFRLHLIEADVQSTPQSIRADVVAYRRDPDLVLLIECKSGRNIVAKQARGYVNADRSGLVRRGTLPGALRDVENVSVMPVFAGNDADREALDESMRRETISAPLLTIGQGVARLTGSSADGLDDFDVREATLGHPPGLIVVDHESPVEEIRELLFQQVQVALAKGDRTLDLYGAASSMHPYWSFVGRVAQGEFLERVKDAARSLSIGDLASDVDFESTNNIAPRLVLLSQPASADPRGMPQAWRGLQRRAGTALGRRPRPQIEGQISMSFDDVAAEAVPDDEAEQTLGGIGDTENDG